MINNISICICIYSYLTYAYTYEYWKNVINWKISEWMSESTDSARNGWLSEINRKEKENQMKNL